MSFKDLWILQFTQLFAAAKLCLEGGEAYSTACTSPLTAGSGIKTIMQAEMIKNLKHGLNALSRMVSMSIWASLPTVLGKV